MAREIEKVKLEYEEKQRRKKEKEKEKKKDKDDSKDDAKASKDSKDEAVKGDADNKDEKERDEKVCVFAIIHFCFALGLRKSNEQQIDAIKKAQGTGAPADDPPRIFSLHKYESSSWT
jgi:hypothetical protein